MAPPNNQIPPNYKTPPFPSLNVRNLTDQTENKIYTLYHVGDVWRFTVIWTLIVYALFHLGAVMIALFTHGSKKKSWKLLWITPIVYLTVAGLEAILSGSIVGLMYVVVLSFLRMSSCFANGCVVAWAAFTRLGTMR